MTKKYNSGCKLLLVKAEKSVKLTIATEIPQMRPLHVEV